MSEAPEAHPVADLFPMLADDELKDLAADIAERGLLQPIVLDAEGRILDGRNRYAACAIAGVEPEFTTYDGDDPDGYALAVNIARRNLNKGQQAVIIARSAEYNNYTREDARSFGVSKQYVSWARLVAKHPDLAEAVLADSMKLAAAYQEARDREERVRGEAAALADLRAQAPDLADAVAEERLSLDDAEAELARRREDEQRRLEVEQIDAMRAADGVTTESFAERAETGALTWEEALTLARRWKADREEWIGRATSRLERVAECLGTVRLLLDEPDSPRTADVLARLAETTRQTITSIVEQMNRSRNG